VRRHLLAPPRALPAHADSVLTVARLFGSLQFDPLESPGGRNHDLVLHARVRAYERAWCDGWLYGPPKQRRLVEIYNKSLNLVPVEELPWHRLAWDRAELRHRKGLLARRPAVARSILERLEREGPAGTAGVAKEHDAAVVGYWGAATSEGRAMLDALFETGRIGIAKRDGNRKHYDLMSRLLPPKLLARTVPREDAVRHRVMSRHRAMGLLGPSGSAELWSGIGPAGERAAARGRLVHDGALVAVHVEGVRHVRYVLGEELEMLEASARPSDDAPAVTFIAPLDPLVWDRRLLGELWDFDYIWEIYTPVAKRKFGYYALPLLYGDRFVGRIEPRMERATSTMTVPGLWFEDGFRESESEDFVRAFADALVSLQRFAGAARLKVGRSAFWKRVAATALR
jgi:hypothetical protein